MANEKRGSTTKVAMTGNALVVDLGSMQDQIAKCMRESGKVSFTISDVSVTKLGGLADHAVIVN